MSAWGRTTSPRRDYAGTPGALNASTAGTPLRRPELGSRSPAVLREDASLYGDVSHMRAVQRQTDEALRMRKGAEVAAAAERAERIHLSTVHATEIQSLRREAEDTHGTVRKLQLELLDARNEAEAVQNQQRARLREVEHENESLRLQCMSVQEQLAASAAEQDMAVGNTNHLRSEVDRLNGLVDDMQGRNTQLRDSLAATVQELTAQVEQSADGAQISELRTRALEAEVTKLNAQLMELEQLRAQLAGSEGRLVEYDGVTQRLTHQTQRLLTQRQIAALQQAHGHVLNCLRSGFTHWVCFWARARVSRYQALADDLGIASERMRADLFHDMAACREDAEKQLLMMSDASLQQALTLEAELQAQRMNNTALQSALDSQTEELTSWKIKAAEASARSVREQHLRELETKLANKEAELDELHKKWVADRAEKAQSILAAESARQKQQALEAALSTVHEEHAAEMAAKQRALDEALEAAAAERAAVDEVRAACDAAREAQRAAEAAAAQQARDHAAALAEKDAALARQQREHDDYVARQQREHADFMAKQQREHDDFVARLRQDHGDEMGQLRDAMTKSESGLSGALAARQAELEDEQQRAEDARRVAEDALARKEEEMQDALARLEAAKDSELDELLKKLNDALAKAATLEDTVAAVTNERDSEQKQKKSVQFQLENQLEQMEDLAAQLQLAQSDLENATAALQAEKDAHDHTKALLRDARMELDDLKEEQAEWEGAAKTGQDARSRLSAELDKLKDDITQLRQLNHNQRAQISRQEQELDNANVIIEKLQGHAAGADDLAKRLRESEKNERDIQDYLNQAEEDRKRWEARQREMAEERKTYSYVIQSRCKLLAWLVCAYRLMVETKKEWNTLKREVEALRSASGTIRQPVKGYLDEVGPKIPTMRMLGVGKKKLKKEAPPMMDAWADNDVRLDMSVEWDDSWDDPSKGGGKSDALQGKNPVNVMKFIISNFLTRIEKEHYGLSPQTYFPFATDRSTRAALEAPHQPVIATGDVPLQSLPYSPGPPSKIRSVARSVAMATKLMRRATPSSSPGGSPRPGGSPLTAKKERSVTGFVSAGFTTGLVTSVKSEPCSPAWSPVPPASTPVPSSPGLHRKASVGSEGRLTRSNSRNSRKHSGQEPLVASALEAVKRTNSLGRRKGSVGTVVEVSCRAQPGDSM
eukprot:TRINITY_DN3568_c0_g1_i1.p1 TRINITY_DN3568_c0_g1~~TRINITY_DN3568_c0_g1_i1.p1  ORF type:complete len:1176 (+),score=454.23 TRINITY_DN3568_c0_g1_i1:137-3664(+)